MEQDPNCRLEIPTIITNSRPNWTKQCKKLQIIPDELTAFERRRRGKSKVESHTATWTTDTVVLNTGGIDTCPPTQRYQLWFSVDYVDLWRFGCPDSLW